MRTKTFTVFSLLLALFACTLTARADELADKGRAIFKKYQRSVVTVEIVLKNKISVAGLPGQSSESRQDVTGTVVDGDGLTVLALSATDPSQLFQGMMMGGGEDETKFKMETELSDIKFLLDDGSEVAGEVVLRDLDLDLAFVRPKSKLTSQVVPLDLTKPGKVEVLEQVVALNRLGKVAGRAYSASIERIAAVVERPRLYYVPDSTATATTLGAPAFTMEGKALGVFVMRALKGHGGGSGMFGQQTDVMASIIVPVADIVKALQQVPAVGEEKKK
jgi:hypothetical protein